MNFDEAGRIIHSFAFILLIGVKRNAVSKQLLLRLPDDLRGKLDLVAKRTRRQNALEVVEDRMLKN